jgi:hypothetical protein
VKRLPGAPFEPDFFDEALQAGGTAGDRLFRLPHGGAQIFVRGFEVPGGQPSVEAAEALQDEGGRIPGKGGLALPEGGGEVGDLLEDLAVRRPGDDASHVAGEGVRDGLGVVEDDFEVRREAEIEGRCPEDRGHEAVDRLHLEVGVAGQDALEDRLGAAGEIGGVEGDDVQDLAASLGVAEAAELEPGQDAGLHLPGRVPGEGHGQDVAEVGGAFLRNRRAQQELDEAQRQGVGFPGAGRGLEKQELRKADVPVAVKDAFCGGLRRSGHCGWSPVPSGRRS